MRLRATPNSMWSTPRMTDSFILKLLMNVSLLDAKAQICKTKLFRHGRPSARSAWVSTAIPDLRMKTNHLNCNFNFYIRGLQYTPRGLQYTPRGLQYTPRGLQYTPEVYSIHPEVYSIHLRFFQIGSTLCENIYTYRIKTERIGGAGVGCSIRVQRVSTIKCIRVAVWTRVQQNAIVARCAYIGKHCFGSSPFRTKYIDWLGENIIIQ